MRLESSDGEAQAVEILGSGSCKEAEGGCQVYFNHLDETSAPEAASSHGIVDIIGGDFRHALPEFDALTAAYARTAGPTSRDALECLQQAAHCRAELGQTTQALDQFQQVLTHVRAVDGDASATALDLRRNIGELLLNEGRATAAAELLKPLYDDLCLVYGPHHEESVEVDGILARLRMAQG